MCNCSTKKYSQKFLKTHKKTPALESFLNKFAGLQPTTLFNKRLQHRCFPVNFANFLIIPFY